MSRQPRVFISRVTTEFEDLSERVAEVLLQRDIEPIIESGFYPSTHDIKGMLAEHLQQCDAVICLIGTAFGSGPHDPITKAGQPVHGLKDPRTKDRLFSYTQLELLIARDLGRPIYTFFIQGDELPSAFAPEPPELAQRQQTFITEFAKDGRNTYGTFSQWDQPADPARGLKQAIEAIKFEITVLAGKPTNLPYTSLGTLFKGRDEFLTELRQHLTAEGPVVIKGKRTIHGMGGVGKTRAAIEYAWKHAADYRALLFISADTPEALHRNLAALCGPLVLNLPEQNEKEQALQVEAALRWLKLNHNWLLIIDNVDTDEAAEETKALLARLTTGHVLITSRISDWTGHVKSLDLDVLSEAASIAFLDERTEERRPKKDDDHERVTALVKLLDGLALALEQAGAHISADAISYADYIELWESYRPIALKWHDEEKMKYPRSLAITYEASVAQLSQGAKLLFRTLSWFAPDPIPRSLLDSHKTTAAASRRLGEIERIWLAQYLGDGKSFTIHRLLQEITRQQQSKRKQPRALTLALTWLNDAFPFQANDSRTWATAEPLATHVEVAGLRASDLNIPAPTARLLSLVAAFYLSKANYSGAEPLMRRALSIFEHSLGSIDPHVASALNNLAQLCHETNRHEEEERLLKRALEISESALSPTHPKIAIQLSNLAGLYYEMHRYKEAEPLLRRAIAIDEEAAKSDDREVPVRLNNLGQLLHVTHRYEEAETLIRRALELDKALYGESHPMVAVDLNNLAALLQSTERHSEAEAMLVRALAIDEAILGPDHPTVSVRLQNLARLLHKLKRYAEAEPLMLRALAITESCFGVGHPRVAIQLNNLAQLLQDTGRIAEAEPLMRRAVTINEASFGVDHSKVAPYLNNLAQLLKATRRYDEGEQLMRRALAINEESFGTNDPRVAAQLNNLGALLDETNRPTEAEPLMRRALEIDEASFGPKHPKVAIRLNNLAQLLQVTGRLDEAKPLMKRHLEIFAECSRTSGRPHQHLGDAIENFHGLLMELGESQEEALETIRALMERYGMSI